MFFDAPFVGPFRWTSITRFIVYESFKHSTIVIVIVTMLSTVTKFYPNSQFQVHLKEDFGAGICSNQRFDNLSHSHRHKAPLTTMVSVPSAMLAHYQNVTVFQSYWSNRVFATAGCRIYPATYFTILFLFYCIYHKKPHYRKDLMT